MYSPHSQLPAPEPKTAEYSLEHFYYNTARYLVKDTVRIMDNGLHIDLEKVVELEDTLKEILGEVAEELAGNPLIGKYLEKRYSKQIKAYIEDRKSKMRGSEYYLKSFKHNDMNHRSYFMEEYATQMGWGIPEEKLPTGVGKWPVNLVKRYAKTNKVLQMLLEGTLPDSTPAIIVAMDKLAEDKARLYNDKYVEQTRKPEVPYPVFNPGSPQQKQELFDMLGIESEATSKDTGLPSWDRDQIERVNRETDDEDVRHLTQCFIDYSFAAIIKNNFIEAFYNYTVEDRLYGQYKLLGAKSGRYTSIIKSIWIPRRGNLLVISQRSHSRDMTDPDVSKILREGASQSVDRELRKHSKAGRKIPVVKGGKVAWVEYKPKKPSK